MPCACAGDAETRPSTRMRIAEMSRPHMAACGLIGNAGCRAVAASDAVSAALFPRELDRDYSRFTISRLRESFPSQKENAHGNPSEFTERLVQFSNGHRFRDPAVSQITHCAVSEFSSDAPRIRVMSL